LFTESPDNDESEADIQIDAALEPGMQTLMKSLRGINSSGTQNANLISAAAITNSLKKAQGVEYVNLQNYSPSSINGYLTISKIEDFLSSPTLKNINSAKFIKLEKTSTGGRITLSLDITSSPDLLKNLSADISDYLSALMAPISTGVKMQGAIYLMLVSSI
jgi:hypothetical protein